MTSSRAWKRILVWTLFLGIAFGLFLVFRDLGQRSESNPEGTPSPSTQSLTPPADLAGRVLLALTLVICSGQLLGKLLAKVGQPAVIGEMLAGILLGPSVLGAAAPAAASFLFPDHVIPYLSVISQLGIILYMFLVGLELNPTLIREKAKTTIVVSQMGIAVPFALGAFLAFGLYPRYSTPGVPITTFSLFLGLSLSVTAFPVLARILTDRKLIRTELGSVALTCAAAADVTAWCLLAWIVGIARADTWGILSTLILTAGLVLVLIFVIRPAAARFIPLRAGQELDRNTVAALFVLLLLSALAAEYAGVHAVFGAFCLGAVLPRDRGLAEDLAQKLEDVIGVLLLPAFFAYTGLRTRIGLVMDWDHGLICLAIVGLATLGKFGGTAITARLTGLSYWKSSALGTLMNTRGLMELIVLNIGMDLHIITPTLFAMLVIMALVTTAATGPVVDLLLRKEEKAKNELQQVS